MRRLLTLLGVVLAALAVSVGQAAAEGSDGAAQAAGQSAASGQGAGAGGAAYQSGPSNSSQSIRVLSPGDNGSTTQSNTATGVAVTANGNSTSQTANQSQAGGPGSDGTQIAGQSSSNRQNAEAGAAAVQLQPSNEVSSIRVLSPGSNGDVSQSNDATAGALAANGNETTQTVDQSQGGGSGGDGTQIAGQGSANTQSAAAEALAVQVKPSNEASSIRVLSPGDDGDVSQSNNATAVGVALNGNETNQSIDQAQGGAAPARSDAKGMDTRGYEKDPGSDYTQIAGQESSSAQSAEAGAAAVQVKPSNEASSIRVLSPGDDGDVSQSNNATAVGVALNGNETNQSIDQKQSGRGQGSDYLQVAGQGSWNRQNAEAVGIALQFGASNENAPIRVLSPGGGGSVEQSNSAGALAVALNLNATSQSLSQAQGGGYGSDSLQVAGQGSWSDQRAGALSLAVQGMLGKKKRR